MPSLLVAGFAAMVTLAIMIPLLVSLRKRQRKNRFAVYGTEISTFQLPDDGEVQFAQWLHPKESLKSISQTKVRALRQFVREGDFVIDIGAHTGDTTVPLALAAGPGGCTLALEPNPYVFKALQVNAQLNRGKTNIVARNFAATSADGVFTFHYSDGGYCNGGFLSQIRNQKHGHHQPLQVQGRALAKVLREDFADKLPRLAFVKVDTEGYDRQVLLSILDILQEYQPVIACEVYSKLTGEEREALFDTLHNASYDCFLLSSDGPSLQGTALTRENMSDRKHFDMLAIPRRQARQAA